MHSINRDTGGKNIRIIIGVAALLGAFAVQASDDTAREAVIRANSIGTGVADKRIEEDRANRNIVSDHSEVGNATNFLNNLKARQDQRNARAQSEEAARNEKHRKSLQDIEKTWNDLNVKVSQKMDIEARNPLDPEDPQAEWKAFVYLQYCVEKYGDGSPRPDIAASFPCYLAKAKWGSGIAGLGVYEPNPKEGMKLLKILLDDDKKQIKHPKYAPWQSYAPEILNYMGEIYFLGLDYPKSKIKQDFGDARDYYEQSISNIKGKLTQGSGSRMAWDTPAYVVDSYYRLIEIYSLGLGTDKDPAKVQALAQEVVARVEVTRDDLGVLSSRPEWPQVKDIVLPYIK